MVKSAFTTSVPLSDKSQTCSPLISLKIIQNVIPTESFLSSERSVSKDVEVLPKIVTMRLMKVRSLEMLPCLMMKAKSAKFLYFCKRAASIMT